MIKSMVYLQKGLMLGFIRTAYSLSSCVGGIIMSDTQYGLSVRSGDHGPDAERATCQITY